MSYFGIPIRNGLPIGLGSVAPLASGGGSPFSPLSLFAGGAPGAWYDPSDFTTLFQDSAGTTPVTAVEQPVGLMLDKSQGLVLGSEQYVTGSGAWTRGFLSVNGTISAAGTAITITQGSSDSSGFRWVQPVTCVVGRSYRLYAGSITLSGGTGATIGFTSSSAGTGLTGDNSITNAQVPLGRYITATATTMYVVISLNGGTTGATATFDNISVKELAGNHAFQATSASRPVLSARYNLLTKTEQFDDAAWGKNNVTITPASAVAPNGTLTAALFTEDGTINSHRVFQGPTTVAVEYSFSFYAKYVSRQWLSAKISDSASASLFAWFDIQNGVVGTVQSGLTASITPVGDGWYRCVISVAAGFVGVNNLIIAGASANGVNTGYAGTSQWLLWGAQIVVTNSLTSNAYQRVNTPTDYATTGFLPYLKFDGVDDSLSTNSISFTSTDKMSVFAGVRKLSDAAIGVIAELSSAAGSHPTGTFVLHGQTSPIGYRYAAGTAGAAFATDDASVFTAPITNVVTGLSNLAGSTLADEISVRINGAVPTQTIGGSVSTGNFGNFPLYIGRRGGTSLPFNGQMYSMIIVGKAVTAGELSSTETYVNQKTGAY